MTRAMTVKQLSAYLRGVFDDEELLHDVTLSGEVFEVSYSDKHTYLTLVEDDVSVKCVHFSSRDNLQKGMRVALRGSVRFYDKKSSVSFCYDEIFLSGNGDKIIAFNELKQRLSLQGYFENRLTLPKYISKVAVLSSREGAAIHDFVKVVRDGCKYVDIVFVPVRVQGENAASEIITALDSTQRLDVDTIVICRGGGSDEDLDCFNDEKLAIAVANSKIPVISAVGHEIDYTLCDYCAGTRAGTPSIAGQIVAERGRAFVDDIVRLNERAIRAINAKYYAVRAKLEMLGARLTKSANTQTAAYKSVISNKIHRACFALEKKYTSMQALLKDEINRLSTAVVANYNSKTVRVEKLSAVLNALNPRRLSENSVQIIYNKKNIRRVGDLSIGDNVFIKFKDGQALATITATEQV